MQRYYQSSIFFALLFLTLSFFNVSLASAKPVKYDYNFYSVVNQTNDSLGDVSIHFEDGSAQIVQVGANQTVSIIRTQAVSSVTINGQTVPVETITFITLPSGKTSKIIRDYEQKFSTFACVYARPCVYEHVRSICKEIL